MFVVVIFFVLSGLVFLKQKFYKNLLSSFSVGLSFINIFLLGCFFVVLLKDLEIFEFFGFNIVKVWSEFELAQKSEDYFKLLWETTVLPKERFANPYNIHVFNEIYRGLDIKSWSTMKEKINLFYLQYLEICFSILREEKLLREEKPVSFTDFFIKYKYDIMIVGGSVTLFAFCVFLLTKTASTAESLESFIGSWEPKLKKIEAAQKHIDRTTNDALFDKIGNVSNYMERTAEIMQHQVDISKAYELDTRAMIKTVATVCEESVHCLTKFGESEVRHGKFFSALSEKELHFFKEAVKLFHDINS
jgi:hypothetical protein